MPDTPDNTLRRRRLAAAPPWLPIWPCALHSASPSPPWPCALRSASPSPPWPCALRSASPGHALLRPREREPRPGHACAATAARAPLRHCVAKVKEATWCLQGLLPYLPPPTDAVHVLSVKIVPKKTSRMSQGPLARDPLAPGSPPATPSGTDARVPAKARDTPGPPVQQRPTASRQPASAPSCKSDPPARDQPSPGSDAQVPALAVASTGPPA
nr:vegetative cell wall protein gp1-like [Aegilops tauschii subsp. strangulata]